MRLLSPKLLILAAVAVAVVPELAKKLKPAARAVADEIIKFGEAVKDAAKPDEETVKAESAATASQEPAASAAKPAPKAAPKVAAKKAKAPAAKPKAAVRAKPAAKKPKTP